MSTTQDRVVVATYTVSLTFKLPAGVDPEKLRDQKRLWVRYGELHLETKAGEVITIEPEDMPDYKSPDDVEFEDYGDYPGLDIAGFSDEESSEDEEEESEDETEEEDSDEE